MSEFAIESVLFELTPVEISVRIRKASCQDLVKLAGEERRARQILLAQGLTPGRLAKIKSQELPVDQLLDFLFDVRGAIRFEYRARCGGGVVDSVMAE